MNTAEQRYEQIERYLQGKLSEPEARAFEAEIAADPGLDALVRQHRLERQGLELLVERNLMAKMQHWDRETEIFQQTQTRSATIRPMRWIMRAAAVLAVTVAGYWFLQQYDPAEPEATAPVASTKPEIKPRVPTVRRPKTKPPRQESPAAVEDENTDMAFEDPVPLNPAPIEEMGTSSTIDYAALADDFFNERDFVPAKGIKGGTGSSGSAAYNQALDNFQDGKYNQVVSKLKPSVNVGNDAVQQMELMALSLYKTKQYDEALSYFRDVVNSGKAPYAQRADWGLVLTVLNQMPAKKPLFDRAIAKILNNPSHPYYSDAQNLKARLGN